MTSPAKAAANRQNAQRSTGPRTPEGKARSSMNALTGGLTARRRVLLADEDPHLYAVFLAEYVDDWQPLGRTEMSLVEDLAWVDWRRARVPGIERAAVLGKMADLRRLADVDRADTHQTPKEPDPDPVGTAFVALLADGTLTQLPRYEAHFTRERERLIALLVSLQRRRAELAASEGAADEPTDISPSVAPAAPTVPRLLQNDATTNSGEVGQHGSGAEAPTGREAAAPSTLGDLQHEATAHGGEAWSEDPPAPVPSQEE